MEECVVTSIEYHVNDPVFCSVILKVKRGEFNDPDQELQTFTVSYHPFENTPDFLVLASKVKPSLLFNWEVGQRVSMYFADEAKYYEGTPTEKTKSRAKGVIKEKLAKDPQFAESCWECLAITWDGNSTESTFASPWELELFGNPPKGVSSTLSGTV
jgi:hypothetical protein